MQATLDSTALKPFVRALACLSKYGEELTIHATPNSFSLSAVNSAKSAYCRFKFTRDFFSKYRINGADGTADSSDIEEMTTVTGQLLTKALLSILKHRTVEKSVEKCELTISERSSSEEHGEGQDGLESKLVVKLHCKHGVIKTHRLLLLVTTSLMTPNVPDSSTESKLCVGPKALKDMIEHFALNKGAKSDPQLIWRFTYDDIILKTMESSLENNKGRVGLSTELILSVEEFDSYDILQSPITIAFHLRELNATIAFAESLGTVLDIRFTQPAEPLFIDVEGPSVEGLFVISTIQPPDYILNTSQITATGNIRKRERDEAPQETPRIKKSMKVVQVAPMPSGTRSSSPNRSQSAIPGMQSVSSVTGSASFFADVPAAESTLRDMPPPPVPFDLGRRVPPPARHYEEEPLFLPSSQLSQAEMKVLRSTGLGVETMDAQELADLLEGDGEEVAFDFASQPIPRSLGDYPPAKMQVDMEGDLEFIPTQSSGNSSKHFRPLFED